MRSVDLDSFSIQKEAFRESFNRLLVNHDRNSEKTSSRLSEVTNRGPNEVGLRALSANGAKEDMPNG